MFENYKNEIVEVINELKEEVSEIKIKLSEENKNTNKLNDLSEIEEEVITEHDQDDESDLILNEDIDLLNVISEYLESNNNILQLISENVEVIQDQSLNHYETNKDLITQGSWLIALTVVVSFALKIFFNQALKW